MGGSLSPTVIREINDLEVIDLLEVPIEPDLEYLHPEPPKLEGHLLWHGNHWSRGFWVTYWDKIALMVLAVPIASLGWWMENPPLVLAAMAVFLTGFFRAATTFREE